MRQKRIGTPPLSGNTALDAWLGEVQLHLNTLPAFSHFSGNPTTVGVVAGQGTIGFDIASGSTRLLWVNTSGDSTSWSSIQYDA